MNGKAGVRLEIPTHLRQTFRLLDSHGSEIKKRHPAAKRSIKFDDSSSSLVLDVKISEEENWIRVDPRAADEARKSRGYAGSSTGKATPGGKAGRRALLLPSPTNEGNSFSQSEETGWSRSRGSSESADRSEAWRGEDSGRE